MRAPTKDQLRSEREMFKRALVDFHKFVITDLDARPYKDSDVPYTIEEYLPWSRADIDRFKEAFYG